MINSSVYLLVSAKTESLLMRVMRHIVTRRHDVTTTYSIDGHAITALFKKGGRSEPGNYSPVSLTSIICKVMESIVKDECYATYCDGTS